jgi:hypothetical protein
LLFNAAPVCSLFGGADLATIGNQPKLQLLWPRLQYECIYQGWPTTLATGATSEFTLWPRATGFGRPVAALYSLMFTITNYQIQRTSDKEILNGIFYFQLSEIK